MNNLKCPNCGGKLDKSPRGEYIYTCQFCGIDVDIQQHLSVDLDSKKRFCKAAHTHIQNGNLRNAGIMLERLELEYPFDKEVQDLRKMYDAAYNEEQDRLKREREQREYDKKREDIIRQISEFEQDVDFWQPNNEEMASHSNYVNLFKLKLAVSLLDKAEEYKIECQKFRALMWELLKNVQSGKLVVGEVSLDENADKYYNMFIMASNINDYKAKIEKTKQAINWKKGIRKKFLITFVSCLFFSILAVVLYKEVLDDVFVLIGTIGILLFVLGFRYVKYPYNILKIILPQTNQQEEFNKDIEELQGKIEETQADFEKVESEYKEITFNKAAAWIEENKELLRERKGE